MALTDMKLPKKSKKELKEEGVIGPSTMDQAEYPYGLSITLENEALDKLGIDIADYSVDQDVKIIAAGCVTRVSSESMKKGKDRRSLQVQIEAMDIGDASDELDLSLIHI